MLSSVRMAAWGGDRVVAKKKKREPFDFGKHKEWVDKEVARCFRASFMSNTKWRKLFLGLDRQLPEGFLVTWKFVGAEGDGALHGLPSEKCIGPAYLNSYFWFGPCWYKEIEWIGFPRVAKPEGANGIVARYREQDLEQVSSVLNDLGQYQLDEVEDGLRLVAHLA